MKTKYFGDYTENRVDTTIQAEELVGTVKVFKREDLQQSAAYLFIDTNERYDLPQFMKKFNNQKVAVLGRKYSKEKNDKIYHKLVVISVRVIKE